MKGGIFLEPKYKRVIIKLSGEALAGSAGHGIDTPTVQSICSQIKEVFELGVEIAIVVGGGNFWRGRSGEGMAHPRPTTARPRRGSARSPGIRGPSRAAGG